MWSRAASRAASASRSVRTARSWFDEERWAAARFDLVVRGNLAKFGQHADLREFLLSTGERESKDSRTTGGKVTAHSLPSTTVRQSVPDRKSSPPSMPNHSSKRTTSALNSSTWDSNPTGQPRRSPEPT
ncbi:NADAR domain-containing protein [Sphaerisporangium sp. NPDC004334]